ncbi:hypothetical protein [Sporosarcina sp. OR05]|uniref:hypothetical protein n=1 Tax=Sporosarcina sp. OR05 TaxID=2969819 RepID=UPI00352A82CF
MIERWLSSNRPIQIEHDEHFVRSRENNGQPISAVREERIQEEVEAQIEVKPLKLRGKSGRMLAEVSFAGTSF